MIMQDYKPQSHKKLLLQRNLFQYHSVIPQERVQGVHYKEKQIKNTWDIFYIISFSNFRISNMLYYKTAVCTNQSHGEKSCLWI